MGQYDPKEPGVADPKQFDSGRCEQLYQGPPGTQVAMGGHEPWGLAPITVNRIKKSHRFHRCVRMSS